MASVIRDIAGGLPTYFTLNSTVVQGVGSGGWSEVPAHALQFARAQDAKEFISKYLVHEMHRIEVADAN